jgi:DNA-binding transcriptional LysR family regulator
VTAEYHRRYPSVRIDGHEISTDKAIEYVLNGKVDFAIVAMDEEDSRLFIEPIYNDRIYVACPIGHPLARKRSVSWSDVACENIVMLRADHNLGRITQMELASSEVATKPMIEVGAMSSVVGLVRAGAGVAFAPEYTTDFCRSEGICLIPFTKKDQRFRTLSLIRRENARLSIAAAEFVALLKVRLNDLQTNRR